MTRMTRVSTRNKTKETNVNGNSGHQVKVVTDSKDAKDNSKNTKGTKKKKETVFGLKDLEKLEDESMLTDFEDADDSKEIEEESEEEEEENDDDEDDDDLDDEDYGAEDEEEDEEDSEDYDDFSKDKSKKKKVERKEMFKCAFCEYAFARKSMLKRHLRIHTGERPYACDKCDSKFTQQGGLKNHILSKHRDELDQKDKVTYQCHHCGRNFIFKERLRIHLRVHTGELPYVCHICSKKFRRNGALLQHLRRHVGMRPYSCEICKASYYNSTNLKTHMKRHLGVQDYVCDLCGKGFTRRDGLRKHLACLHYDQCAFRCSICNKSFKGHILSHLRMHLKEKPFKCEECGMRFVQSSQLVVHRRTHTGAKPYPCQICKVAFSHSSALRMHIRRHTGEKPVKCLLCPAAFVQLPHLKKHMRCIHKTDKPYVCVPCYQFFKTKAELDEHITANDCKPAPLPVASPAKPVVVKSTTDNATPAEASVPRLEAATPGEASQQAEASTPEEVKVSRRNQKRKTDKVTSVDEEPVEKNRYPVKRLRVSKYASLGSSDDDEESEEAIKPISLKALASNNNVESSEGESTPNAFVLPYRRSSTRTQAQDNCSKPKSVSKSKTPSNVEEKSKAKTEPVKVTRGSRTRSTSKAKDLEDKSDEDSDLDRTKKIAPESPKVALKVKLPCSSPSSSGSKTPPANSPSRRSSGELKIALKESPNTVKDSEASDVISSSKPKNSTDEKDSRTRARSESPARVSLVTLPICEPLKSIDQPHTDMVEKMMQKVTNRLKKGKRTGDVVVKTTNMTIEKIRMLLAILLTRISTPDRLKALGFGKILIDEVLCASIISSGRAPCDKTGLSEREIILQNVQILLDWTVPKIYMERFKRENRSTEDLLEELTS